MTVQHFRPFRRRLSLQVRRSKPNQRCAPSNLIPSFHWPWIPMLYSPWGWREMCGLPTGWGKAEYTNADMPLRYVHGGWNFDGPHQPPLWYGEPLEDVAWESDNKFVYMLDPGGRTESYAYEIPVPHGVSGYEHPAPGPPRPWGIL